MKSTKDRIVEYLENQRITKSDFCQKAGLSNGYLTQNGAVTSANLEKIVKAFPDINLHYIVLGEEIINTNDDVQISELLLNLNAKVDKLVTGQTNINSFIEMLKGLADLERFKELLGEHKPVKSGEPSKNC